MMVTVVALSRYSALFKVFRDTLDPIIPADVRKILVRDGTEIQKHETKGWEVIQGREPFSMAHNHNVGWRAVSKDSDILNLNDDIYFSDPNTLTAFQLLAYSSPIIGAVCASAAPGSMFGNPLQMRPRQDRSLTFAKTCSNGCTYFKRECIDQVGLYDEGFDLKYGAEDADYTHRINLAGFKCAISRDIKCKHGFEGERSTSTIRRSYHFFRDDSKTGIQYFKNKWGHFDVHGEAE